MHEDRVPGAGQAGDPILQQGGRKLHASTDGRGVADAEAHRPVLGRRASHRGLLPEADDAEDRPGVHGQRPCGVQDHEEVDVFDDGDDGGPLATFVIDYLADPGVVDGRVRVSRPGQGPFGWNGLEDPAGGLRHHRVGD